MRFIGKIPILIVFVYSALSLYIAICIDLARPAFEFEPILFGPMPWLGLAAGSGRGFINPLTGNFNLYFRNPIEIVVCLIAWSSGFLMIMFPRFVNSWNRKSKSMYAMLCAILWLLAGALGNFLVIYSNV